MLTAWLTCSQHLFLWVLKIKEKSAGRSYLSPRPLCVSGSPETYPCCMGSGLDPPLGKPLGSFPCAWGSLYQPWVQRSACSTCLMQEPGSPGGTSFALPWLPVCARQCWCPRLGLYGSHIACVRYESSCWRAWGRNGTNCAWQRGSPGSPAVKGPVFTSEAALCFLRGSSHAALVQKNGKNGFWYPGAIEPEVQILI